MQTKLIKLPFRSAYFLCGLLLLALFIRFPFFFRDYIDKDESTFILMGQAWADGFLPYTFLWDLKPPLTFAYFAGIIALFGKSFVWIRLGGVLIVSVTTWLVYLCAQKSGVPKNISRWASAASLVFSSLFGSVQGVMSEHISMLFFMGGIYLLIAYRNKTYPYLLAGVLLGFSAMSKLNLAYAILPLGFLVAYNALISNKRQATSQTVLMALGGVLSIGSTALPYLYIGKGQLWWSSIFLASGSYAQINVTNSLILIPFIVGVLWYVLRFKNNSKSMVGWALVGVLSSFLFAGKLNGHYLLQAYPLLFVLIAMACRRIKWSLPKWTLFLLLLIPMESYLEYAQIYQHKQEKDRYYNGEGIDIPLYLKSLYPEVPPTVFFEYHIGYWLLDQQPPSMAMTHPSNIFRTRLFPFFNKRNTTTQELSLIFEDQKLPIIVIDKKHSLFKNHPKEKAYFEEEIAKNYIQDTLIGKGVIYIRKGSKN